MSFYVDLSAAHRTPVTPSRVLKPLGHGWVSCRVLNNLLAGEGIAMIGQADRDSRPPRAPSPSEEDKTSKTKLECFLTEERGSGFGQADDSICYYFWFCFIFFSFFAQRLFPVMLFLKCTSFLLFQVLDAVQNCRCSLYLLRSLSFRTSLFTPCFVYASVLFQQLKKVRTWVLFYCIVVLSCPENCVSKMFYKSSSIYTTSSVVC